MNIVERLSLKGKVAIITGAGRGIGRGVDQAFAEAPAHITGQLFPVDGGWLAG